MDRTLDEYRVGQIVISKRGKDVGRAYVIAGFVAGNRLVLVDGKRFYPSRPKLKNPRHVQATSCFVDAKLAALIEADRVADHGELRRFLTLLRTERPL